jgi:hypothetical protein
MGYPVPGGNKYRNLAAFLVWGVSKIETNMFMSPMGLRSEKGCADDAQQKLKTTDPIYHQRGRPTSTNL